MEGGREDIAFSSLWDREEAEEEWAKFALGIEFPGDFGQWEKMKGKNQCHPHKTQKYYRQNSKILLISVV